ncbi:hypothetical protein SH528x_004292 [Novipirellula sp. SH528]
MNAMGALFGVDIRLHAKLPTTEKIDIAPTIAYLSIVEYTYSDG